MNYDNCNQNNIHVHTITQLISHLITFVPDGKNLLENNEPSK